MALSLPEVRAEATNGAATCHTALSGQADRSCSGCRGPLPATHSSGAERLTCSPRCAQHRHNRLRHNRLRQPKESPPMKALQLATVPSDVEARAAPAVPGPSLATTVWPCTGTRSRRARSGDVPEHAAAHALAGRAGARKYHSVMAYWLERRKGPAELTEPI